MKAALLRRACHCYAAAALEVERPSFTENSQSTEHGVLIHAEVSGDVFWQGKALTGSGDPSAMALRTSAATWSYRGVALVRSTLTSNMVLGIVDLCRSNCQARRDDYFVASRAAAAR
jgi:hypothetical protein